MTTLLLLSLALSLTINGIYIVFNWEGMLFEKLGLAIEGVMPEWFCKMLFTCATCMSGIHGLAWFLLFGYRDALQLIVFVLMTACISTAINIVLECAKSLREYLDDELGRTVKF